MTRKLTRLALERSDNERLCLVWSSESGGRVAWLRLFGECERPTDAMWIQWQVDAANEVVEPRGMLVDVRELTVQKAQLLTLIPRARRPKVLVVASPEQRDALEPMVGEILRTDIDAAAAELEQRMREPRPTYERKQYDWTEVWTDANAEFRLLRHAGDGSLDIFDPTALEKRQIVLRTFFVEDDALDYLRGLGFHRVEGRTS